MNILNYLDNTEKQFSEKIAIEDESEKISYKTLKMRAEIIGTTIIKSTSKENHPIAVLIDRNAASICVFLGIVESHNFYVPIDATQPVERIQTIISEMQPVLLISIHKNIPEGIHQNNLKILEYDEILENSRDNNLLKKRRQNIIDTDPLYAICTSGSTGVPKGVLISHRSVLDFIPVFAQTFDLSNNDIFGNQAPFDFDVSVKDIYSSLYLGASLVIIPKICFVLPKKLVEILDDKKITCIIWAVSALCIPAGFNAFNYRIPRSLSKIMFSGEVMPIKMLNIWRKNFPNALFVNLYGPTEITCNCTYYIVDRHFEENEKLPLGIPFENEGILVLNNEDKEISTGEIGEICVRGTCLALGYYNNPYKTKDAFVQNPLNDKYPELIYRTGDLAVLGSDGEYYFSGRKDFQIKHMGHRIELEEIEAHINSVESVLRACCLFDEDHNKIVSFFSGSATKEEIIAKLKKKLPKYMIPNIFIPMDNLPVTKNGKIDRKQLKAEYEGK